MRHRSVMKGSESHKKIDLSGNFILRHYYTNRVSNNYFALFFLPIIFKVNNDLFVYLENKHLKLHKHF